MALLDYIHRAFDGFRNAIVRGDLLVGNSDGTPSLVRLPLGSSGSVLKSNGTDAIWTNPSTLVPVELAAEDTEATPFIPGTSIQVNPFPRASIIENGFVNYGNDSAISFVDATRTFSIAPTGTSYTFWSNNQPWVKYSTLSLVIANTEGVHVVYFDTTGALAEVVGAVNDVDSIPNFTAAVCTIYWDATNGHAIIFGDERHGREMNERTHQYLHETRHTAYDSGLGLTNFDLTGTGATNAMAQFGVSGGSVWDEDLQLTITPGSPQTLAAPAAIPMYYLSGSTPVFRKVTATTFPFAVVSSVPQYNLLSGGSWALANVTNNDYFLCHYFATDNISEPIIGVVGQNLYTHNADAQVGIQTELKSLVFGGTMSGLTPEFLPIASIIFQYKTSFANTPKVTIVALTDGSAYFDWRQTLVGGGSSGGSNISIGNPVNGGTPNEVLFVGAGPSLAQDANLTWDATDLAIGSGNRFRMQSQNRTRFLNSMARVEQNSAQTGLSPNAATAYTFGVNAFDTDGIHSVSVNTSRMTCQLAGTYAIIASITCTGTGLTSPSAFYGLLKLNGATFIAEGVGAFDTNQNSGVNLSTTYRLAVNDYIEVYGDPVASGGTWATGGSNLSNLNLVYLGE